MKEAGRQPGGSGSAGPPARAVAVAAGLSGERSTTTAAEAACDQCARGLAEAGGGGADLVIACVSSHHADAFAEVGRVIRRTLAPRHVLGVAAESVIGASLEFEGVPGISLLALRLPGVDILPFSSEDLPPSIHRDDAHDDDDDLAALGEAVGMRAGHRGTILFADPATTPSATVLPALARARNLCAPGGAAAEPDDLAGPGRRGPIVGGMASASGRAGPHTMFLDGRVVTRGLVGVSLAGQIRLDAVVSQGCRGFGPNVVVTAAKGQVIQSLGGRPALEVVREVIETLSEEQRDLLSRHLFLGRVVNEYKERFGPGDYLIRQIVGVSKEGGAIAVADQIRVGQTVRFFMRDPATAEADLAMLLDGQAVHGRPEGCLLISCNGRGTQLFPRPHQDATTVQRAFADPPGGESKAKGGSAAGPRPTLPLAGFFAAGEIGPVGDGVYLHAQTACAVLFRKP